MNHIVVNIKENNKGIATAADVTNSILGTHFSFGHANDSKTAQYTFTFMATQNCLLRDDQKDYTDRYDTPGVTRFYSQNIPQVLRPRMNAEYVAPPPPPPPQPEPEPVVEPVPTPEPTP